MVLVALQISTIPGSMGRCEPVRGGLPRLASAASHAPDGKGEGGWVHAGRQPRP